MEAIISKLKESKELMQKTAKQIERQPELQIKHNGRLQIENAFSAAITQYLTCSS
jgi:hypothetical protein